MTTKPTRFISIKLIDAKGNMRNKIIKSGDSLGKTNFDGSSVGLKTVENSDIVLVPDKTTFYDPILKVKSTMCFITDPDGKPLDNCFRTKAKLAMEADEETRGAKFGIEPEFFICKWSQYDKKMIPIDINQEADLEIKKDWYGCLPPMDSFNHIRYSIINKLEETGIFDVESVHHECSPGQYEISWACDNLLRTSDKMIIFKYIVSAVCVDYGFTADFRAKPFNGINGSGCHCHSSIPCMKDNKPVIETYAQGLVDHYDELLGVCCVGETSQNRLVPGFESPTRENNGWGYYDRTKTVRIPAGNDRVEFRLPDPEMNPYVALPMILKYGYENVMRIK